MTPVARLLCRFLLLGVGLLSACGPPPPNLDVEGPNSPVIVSTGCDGTFSTILTYTTNSTTAFPATGTLGPKTDFSDLSASASATRISADPPIKVTVNGTLKDPCKAGLTSYSLAAEAGHSTAVTNINVPAVPFSSVDVPPSTPSRGQNPATFEYKVKFTCCAPGAGMPAGPFAIEASSVPSGVDVTKIAPKKVRCTAAGDATTVTVSGTVGSPYDGLDKIILKVRYSDGKYCALPGTKISG